MSNEREEHRRQFAEMCEEGKRKVVVIPAKPEFSAPIYEREESVGETGHGENTVAAELPEGAGSDDAAKPKILALPTKSA